MGTYEDWSLKQLTENQPCRVEPSTSCIPLREDPMCQACFEEDITQEQALGKVG